MNSTWKLAIPLLFLSTSMVLSQDFPPLRAPANKAPVKYVRVSGGVMAGLRINFVQPVYPPEAKAKHVSGVVVLHVLISKEGTVEKAEAISGAEELRAASIEAVRQWRYKPFLLNGEPVAVDTTVSLSIQVSGSPPDSPQP